MVDTDPATIADDSSQQKLGNMAQLDPSGQYVANVKLTYPYSEKFDYFTQLTKIDLDAERIRDLKTGKGFLIQSSKSIKTDVKNQLGIFSSRYGSTISDIDSFNGKYRCKCGYTKGSIMHGEQCPICHTIVKYLDDDVSIFGWLILKDKYFVIHPNIYRVLEAFIEPNRLARIIEPIVKINSDGQIIQIGEPDMKHKEPFKGKGMFFFREHYDEILDYYLSCYPNKRIYYDDLKASKDITFTHSIPVFSALLRPSVLEQGSILKYQSVNDWFMILSRLVNDVNRDKFKMDQKPKEKLILLNDIQVNLNAVYNELKEQLSHKRGYKVASILW